MSRRTGDEGRGRGRRPRIQTICAYPDAAPLGHPGASAVYWLARGEERGEDFPVSSWPLVVKCDADLSRPQIIEMLRWLAARLEHDADADEALLVRWP